MSEFSEEQKRYIVLNVMEMENEPKVLSIEEIWHKLGGELGCSWVEIRDTYFSCINSDTAALPEGARMENIKEETENQPDQHDSIQEDEVFIVDQFIFGNLDNDELRRTLNEEYAVHDSQQFAIENPESFENVDNKLQVGVKKRLRDLSSYDLERLKILEEQSKEELEMKRKEHEKKMNYYSMQMKNGVELHKERMKIYLAKYQSQLDKISEIDHVICNKKLSKRFKSGPI